MEAASNKTKGTLTSAGGASRMEGLDVERVLELARSHDPEAHAELYRRYARRVFGLCQYLLGAKETAEDATSEVFLKLQRSVSSYDGSAPFLSWLLRVTSNHCLDTLRRKQRDQRVILPAELDDAALAATSPQPSPLRDAINAEERAAVRQAIAGLPQNYRVPLVLRYYSDLSYDEIAQQLRLSRSHVAVLIFRGKRALRRALAGGDTEP